MKEDKNALSSDREKALELAIAKIRKEHGEGSIMKMSEESIKKEHARFLEKNEVCPECPEKS